MKYPTLFQIAEIKVFALLVGVESIKQVKDEVTILLSEDTTNRIDGQKVFKLTNQYGRMVGLGMEGKRLKIVLHVKKVELTTWFNAIFEIFKGLHEKEENSADVRFIT